jgi:multicomponent K+:H+ antiporter subunit A
LLVWALLTRPFSTIAWYYLEHAKPQGGGYNVVNVILVDFRGFDTLGEITVLVIVALTTYALLRRFRPAPDSVDVPEQQREQAAYDEAHPRRRSGEIVADWLMAPSSIGRVLFPVIALFSVFLLVRGHDLPGGGFAAGLTASIGLILQYMIGGTQWIEGRLRVLPLKWMGFGLLFAAATGLAAMLVGRPFLTTYFAYADIPVLGAVPLASALIFDAGVFMVVIGATALILIALAHQSVRAHRSAPAKQEPRAFEALGGE